MLCEKCHLRPASVSYHQIVRGDEEWLYLCDDCAKSLDLTNLFEKNLSDFSAFVENMYGAQLEGRVADMPTKKRCPICNKSFDEIAKKGKLGCSRCYDVFSAELKATLSRLHGANSTHCGKSPARFQGAGEEDNTIHMLQSLLEDAVSRQAFEEAAKLRDRIRLLSEEKEEAK